MKDNRNTFPKLETGMVVRVACEQEGFGPYVVFGDRLLSKDGWIPEHIFESDGRVRKDCGLDIVEVFQDCNFHCLDITYYVGAHEPSWKLQYVDKRQLKIAELEETIKKASQQIQQLKEEING